MGGTNSGRRTKENSMPLIKTPSGGYIYRNLPQMDVDTQIDMARQSGQLSGPGFDIPSLQRAGLVTPSRLSAAGIDWRRPSTPTNIQQLGRQPIRTAITPTTAQLTGGTKVIITIPATAAERASAVKFEQNCAGGTCLGLAGEKYGRPLSLYVAKLRDGRKVYIEATDATSAKTKAKAAGYDPWAVSWVPGYSLDTTTRGEVTPEETPPEVTTPSKKSTSAAAVTIKDEMGGTVQIPKDQFDALPAKQRLSERI